MSFADFVEKFVKFRQSGQAVRFDTDDNKEDYDRITQEPVLAIQPDGQVLVGGTVGAKLLNVLSKSVQIKVGELVYVAWRKAIPVGILKFAWQKGQFAPSGRQAFGIIEELFIANDPKTDTLEIYFRNDKQVTNLKIAAFLEDETPVDVNWGKTRDNFVVTTGETPAETKWWIFSIDRDPDKVLGTKKPTATLGFTFSFEDLELPLSRIDFNFSRATQAAVPHVEKTTGSETFAGFHYFNDEALITRRLTLSLSGGDVTIEESEEDVKDGTVSISELSIPVLDVDNLFVAVKVQFTNFGCLPGTADGLLGWHEVLSETGSDCPNRETVGPAPFERFSDLVRPYFRLKQQHIILLNIATNEVIWSTLQPEVILSAQEDLGAWRLRIPDGTAFYPTNNVLPDALFNVPESRSTFASPWSSHTIGAFAGGATTAFLEFFDGPNPNFPEITVLLMRWIAVEAGAAGNGIIITFQHVADATIIAGDPETEPFGHFVNGALGGSRAKAVVSNVTGSSITIQWQRGVQPETTNVPGPTDVILFSFVASDGSTNYWIQERVRGATIATGWSASTPAKALATLNFVGSGPDGFPSGQPSGVFEPEGAFGFTGGSGASTTAAETCISISEGSTVITVPFDDPNTQELGLTGDWGIKTSEDNLYTDLIPFMDTLTGDAQFLNILKKLLFHFRGDPSGSPASASAFYNTTLLVSRYEPFITATPFYSKDGIVRTFVVVTVAAQNPVGVTEAASDNDFYGVFVLVGNEVRTLKEFGSSVQEEPFLIAASGRRLLWADDLNVQMTDLEVDPGGVPFTQEVGTDKISFIASLTALLTNPDFLIAESNPSETGELKFINGWDRATAEITLDQNEDGFPPEDVTLKSVVGRATLPEGVVPIVSSTQTINDKSILGPLGVNEEDAPIPHEDT